MSMREIDPEIKALVFGLDNVLYPERDYLLQVYYLFANFLEYTEGVPSSTELTSFFKKAYEHHGAEGLFEKASAVFGISEQYKTNFERLHVTAQLPLKLLLYREILELIRSSLSANRSVMILTKGNPLVQLNKLKHIEWHGLASQIKIYFEDEIRAKGEEPMAFLLSQNELNAEDVLYISPQPDERITQETASGVKQAYAFDFITNHD